MFSVIPKPGVIGAIICSHCGAEIDVNATLVAALDGQTERIHIGATLDITDLEFHMAGHGILPEGTHG